MKTLTLSVVLFFALAGTAAAHSFHFRPSLAHRSLAGRAAGQRLILHHDRAMIRLLRPYVLARRPSASMSSAAAARVAQAFRFHSAQLAWTTRELRKTEAAIRARARARSVGHLRGWLCIHLGVHFNSTGWHEGNSSSGTYTGPLQMTNPWMGHSAPGGNWAATSMRAVFAIAESVAAAQGFRYSFMAGQWPHTFPPCSNYF